MYQSSWLFFRVYKRTEQERILIQTLRFYKRNHFFLTDKLEFSIKHFTVFQTFYLFKKIIHSKYTPQILTKGNRPSQNEDGPFFASATQASRR